MQTDTLFTCNAPKGVKGYHASNTNSWLNGSQGESVNTIRVNNSTLSISSQLENNEPYSLAQLNPSKCLSSASTTSNAEKKVELVIKNM